MANPNVILRPTTNSAGHVKWQMEVVGVGTGGPGKYPTLTVKKGNQDQHLVFKIENPPGATWKFAKDAAALWVGDQGQDPTSPSTNPQVPVNSIKTKQQDTELHFHDLNSKTSAETLHYTLNFVNGMQKSSTIDPIIQNDGCCQFGQSFLVETGNLVSNPIFDAWIGIAFVAGILATMGARWIRNR